MDFRTIFYPSFVVKWVLESLIKYHACSPTPYLPKTQAFGPSPYRGSWINGDYTGECRGSVSGPVGCNAFVIGIHTGNRAAE
jgi:hypothetical protein